MHRSCQILSSSKSVCVCVCREWNEASLLHVIQYTWSTSVQNPNASRIPYIQSHTRRAMGVLTHLREFCHSLISTLFQTSKSRWSSPQKCVSSENLRYPGMSIYNGTEILHSTRGNTYYHFSIIEEAIHLFTGAATVLTTEIYTIKTTVEEFV